MRQAIVKAWVERRSDPIQNPMATCSTLARTAGFGLQPGDSGRGPGDAGIRAEVIRAPRDQLRSENDRGLPPFN